MSHPQDHSGVDDSDLNPTTTQGYKVGEKKSMAEYEQLDAEDPAMVKWKASLGLGPGGGPSGVDTSGPNIVIKTLSLKSDSRSAGPIVLDLTQPGATEQLKKNPVTIKEGAEYSVELGFVVNHSIVSGLRYIQVVKRSGVKVDKLESMIGSYGPSPNHLTKQFVSEEAPSGMLARSGTYIARSRIIDDDNNVYADFEWSFKIGKDW